MKKGVRPSHNVKVQSLTLAKPGITKYNTVFFMNLYASEHDDILIRINYKLRTAYIVLFFVMKIVKRSNIFIRRIVPNILLNEGFTY